MKTLAEKIAVMQAALEGKKIEYRFVMDDHCEWNEIRDLNKVAWNWDVFDYRIAPEPDPRIDPGEGWRLLRDDEILQKDDEWAFVGRDEFSSCSCERGMKVEARKKQMKNLTPCDIFFRRRVPEYRPIRFPDEAEQWLGVKGRFKNSGSLFIVTFISGQSSCDELLEDAVQLNGEPFGVEVTA